MQAIGEKKGKSMKTKTKYTVGPMEHLRVVKDFLPSVDKLVLKDVKVTISLKNPASTFLKNKQRSRRLLTRK